MPVKKAVMLTFPLLVTIGWTPVIYIPVAPGVLDTGCHDAITGDLSENKSLVSRSVKSESVCWSFSRIWCCLCFSSFSPWVRSKGRVLVAQTRKNLGRSRGPLGCSMGVNRTWAGKGKSFISVACRWDGEESPNVGKVWP